MRRFRGAILFAALVLVSACDVARYAALTPAASGATQRIVFVSSPPEPLAQSTSLAQERPEDRVASKWIVSIPPNHEKGQIEWRPTAQANPARSFTVNRVTPYDNHVQLYRDVAEQAAGRDVFVYVHGFNTTVSEAGFRMAQMGHDFEQSQPSVVFGWPSAAQPAGYVFDRDGVLFARDDLRELVEGLNREPHIDRVVLVAHSLGAGLVMEVMRELRVLHGRSVSDWVSGVIFIAPDIDPQVFRKQAKRIGPLPKPFVVFGSQQDRALRLSSLIGGGRPRLGTLNSLDQLEGLDVTLVDMSAVQSDMPLNHFPVAGSEDAINLILKMRDEGGLLRQGRYVALSKPAP